MVEDFRMSMIFLGAVDMDLPELYSTDKTTENIFRCTCTVYIMFCVTGHIKHNQTDLKYA